MALTDTSDVPNPVSVTSTSTSTAIRKPSRSNSIDENKLLISSYLYKKSSKSNNWKLYWVVLRKLQLNYYIDNTEHKPKKVYNLSRNLKLFTILKNDVNDKSSKSFLVYTNDKILQFRTKDNKEFKKWIEALKEMFGMNEEEDVPVEYNNTSSFHNHSGNGSLSDSSNDSSSGGETVPKKNSHHHSSVEEKLQQLSNLPENEISEISSITSDKYEYLIEKGKLKLDLHFPNNTYRSYHNHPFLKWKKVFAIFTNKSLYIYKRNSRQYLLKVDLKDIIDVVEIETFHDIGNLSRRGSLTAHHDSPSTFDVNDINYINHTNNYKLSDSSKTIQRSISNDNIGNYDWKFRIIASTGHYVFKAKTENDLLTWLSCFKTLIRQLRQVAK
ncbi:uncharacterized protein RJT21DRAFT_3470 [Scheffersomyces amazonensis]|uniref:uncharacterized protein n=1 Tax=Scheffersomyces amazonensis TaxID=1078765 RepID=UPI00315DE752